MVLAAAGAEVAAIFLELGAMVVGLAVLARLASHIGFSPIPLYLLAGLAFGQGGLLPLTLTTEFIQIGAEIGVILLLFMIGLEYTGEELTTSLRAGLPAGLMDLVLNFTPGFVAGLLFGWGPVAALVLGGVTYISSSGVIAKMLGDLDRLGNRETPVILSILVLEDLAMAVYLPLLAVLLMGTGVVAGVISLTVAIATVAVVLLLALRYGHAMSRVIDSRSDEVVLLTVFGLILLVAGLSEQLQVSAAVGAFLVGIALSGEVAEHTRTLLEPLRDLFAALFFLFFGLQIDPASLPPVLIPAIVLGLVTAATKVYTGWWAARRNGIATRGRFRAGFGLVARGEFSIVIAGLAVGAGLTAQLGPFAAAYVLLLAIAGPILARVSDPVVVRILQRQAAPAVPAAAGAGSVSAAPVPGRRQRPPVAP